MSPTRRSLLIAAPSLLSLVRVSGAWGASGSDPFSLGVASGDPSGDGFVIWTRLATDPLALDGLGGMAGPAEVHWVVAEDEALTRIAASGQVQAQSGSAYAVHVELAGLRPDRTYWYRFTALGAQSPTGRARTLPAPGQPAERLRIGVASCAHYETGWFSAYRHMAGAAADLNLFVGDYIYDYSYPRSRPGLVRFHGAGQASTLAGYRHRYARYKTDPDLQMLHASAPCLVTWDDHEVENDYAERWSQIVSTSPETFLLRRAAAYQAFYEHMPVRRARTQRLYGRTRFGDLAEIAMLDTRQYRDRPACLPPTTRRARVIAADCAERLDPVRTMLGAHQEAWLYDGFRRPDPARWNLIGQSLMAASVLQKGPGGIIGHWSDGWDGYPATRDRLLSALADSGLPNPVVLSGDIHSFWANEIKRDARNPCAATVATEFVTSAISADGPPAQPFAEMAASNPQVRFFDTGPRGYLALDLTRDRLEARFRAISDRTDPAATVSTLRSFTVEAGRPGIA